MHITTFILSLFVAKFYTFILSQTHRKIYFLTKMLIRNTGLWISFNVYIIFSLPPPSSSPFNRCSRAKKLQFSVFFFWCDFFSRLLSNFFLFHFFVSFLLMCLSLYAYCLRFIWNQHVSQNEYLWILMNCMFVIIASMNA